MFQRQTEMVQIGQAHQGQIVKFSDDALTILFPAKEEDMGLAIFFAGFYKCIRDITTKQKHLA